MQVWKLGARNRRGNTFVEGALVLTIVIFTLVGIVDLGQVLVLHQGITERLRAGSRWAIVNAYDATRIRNVVLYNNPDAPTGSKPLLLLKPEMVLVNRYSVGTPEERIEIRVNNYRFHFFTPWIKGDWLARPIVVSAPTEGMGATT